MNQGNELHNCRRCVLLIALILVMISGMDVPAFADSNRLLESIVINTPSSHERSIVDGMLDRLLERIVINTPSSPKSTKVERQLAVENARRTFEYATTVGGEKAAPYEYYLAKEYLSLALKELGEGDKIGVVQFAAESEKYSRVARQKAEGKADRIGDVQFAAESEKNFHVTGEMAKEGS